MWVLSLPIVTTENELWIKVCKTKGFLENEFLFEVLSGLYTSLKWYLYSFKTSNLKLVFYKLWSLIWLISLGESSTVMKKFLKMPWNQIFFT